MLPQRSLGNSASVSVRTEATVVFPFSLTVIFFFNLKDYRFQAVGVQHDPNNMGLNDLCNKQVLKQLCAPLWHPNCIVGVAENI